MQTSVISVGGSLIYPYDINPDFLEKFKDFVDDYTTKGNRLILVAGGGRLARIGQESLDTLVDNRYITGRQRSESKDWIGIYATHFNAELLRLTLSLNDISTYPNVIKIEEDAPKDFKESVLVSGGWLPGCSTDKDAVLLAIKYGCKDIVNLTNTNGIYNQDPNLNQDAKKIDRLSWQEYIEMIGKIWKPGLSTPFDPMAAKLAQDQMKTVAIINGNDLSSLENYLRERPINGTLISG